MLTPPVLPTSVVPELRTMDPLEPTEIASALRINTEPLDDDAPAPLASCNNPPTPTVELVSPARIRTAPPAPEFVEPAAIEMDPLAPLTADPTAMKISPAGPPVELPDAMVTWPELPAAVVPEDSVIPPLDPIEIELAVNSIKSPLEDDAPEPVTMVTEPP